MRLVQSAYIIYLHVIFHFKYIPLLRTIAVNERLLLQKVNN